MAEIYKSHGFHTSAITASFAVNSKFGLSQGFDEYDENFGYTEILLNLDSEISADRVYKKFQNWIENYKNKDKENNQKFFLWVHFHDPHFPYFYHQKSSGGQPPSLMSRYASEVHFLDTYIGKMMETMATSNLWDNTVVVLVGSHGEALGEHGEIGHGIFCYEESLKVPLIIHNPKIINQTQLIAERISLVDILPTLLELNNFSIPSLIQGQSFLTFLQEKKEKKPRAIYFESLFGQEEHNWAPLLGIINADYDHDYKFISLPQKELYHLKTDARETRNLFDSQKKIAADMEKDLKRFINDNVRGSSLSKVRIDPKQGIKIYAQQEEVNSLFSQSQFRLAEDKYKEIISSYPGIETPGLFHLAFRIEKSKGNTNAALNALQKAINRFPQHEYSKIGLAREYLMAGRLTETEELCRELLAENDKMTQAYILLGNANLGLNKLEEARNNYAQAAAIEPQNVMIKVNYASLLMKNNELRKSRDLVNELERSGYPLDNFSSYREVINELGSRFLAQGEMQDALPILKKVTGFAPENPEVWLNLGSAYFGSNRLDEALETFRKILDLNKDHAVAHTNIGLVYLRKHDVDKKDRLLNQALASFERAIRLSPSLGDAYHGRALAKSASGKNDEAVKDFAMAIELSPELINAYFNISDVLRKMGNASRAYEYLSLCKKRFYDQLSPSDQAGLDKLLDAVKKEIK